MGTRNLTIVKKDGETKIAKYGQWDGYPAGVGEDILSVLKCPAWSPAIVSECGLLTEEEAEALGDNWLELYPYLSRDFSGGRFLEYVLLNGPKNSLDMEDFAADSLFCEWCYVIDLDKNTFEVYRGFNTIELDESERFAYLKDKCKEGYQPVKHLRTYSLSDLPDSLDELEEKDEDA